MRLIPDLVFGATIFGLVTSLVWAAGDSSGAVSNTSNVKVSDDHRAEALRQIKESLGLNEVDDGDLIKRFFDSIAQAQSSSIELDPAAEATSDCRPYVKKLNGSAAKRRLLLICLTLGKRKSLTQGLRDLLMLKRAETLNHARQLGVWWTKENLSSQLEKQEDREAQSDLALIFLVDDLVTSELSLRSKQARYPRWFVKRDEMESVSNAQPELSFLPLVASDDQSDDQLLFPYQKGDILLSVGGAYVSSLIPQITSPRTRYAHAFIVDKEPGGQPELLEALIEKGVVRSTNKEFKDHLYHQLVVLRIRDKKDDKDNVNKGKTRRKAIAESMVSCASGYAERKTPYDPEMNFFEDSKMFCDELVIRCLAEAIKKVDHRNDSVVDIMKEVSPRNSRIDGTSFEFAKNLGVLNQVMSSPGDLLYSPELEIVATYRKNDDVNYSWRGYFAAAVFLNKMKKDGFRLHPPDEVPLDLVGGLILQMGLPDALTPESYKFLMGWKLIFNEAVAAVPSSNEGILSPSVLELYASSLAAFDQKPKIRAVFNQKGFFDETPLKEIGLSERDLGMQWSILSSKD